MQFTVIVSKGLLESTKAEAGELAEEGKVLDGFGVDVRMDEDETDIV